MEVKWWLMTSSFPDLNWAKQTICNNGEVEITDCDGSINKFNSVEESVNCLLEDEFTEYQKLD